MIINNNTIRTRSEREAIAKRQEETGIGTPGDPILSMSISDFGATLPLCSPNISRFAGASRTTIFVYG
jgi:hypothetical protein